MRYLWATGVKRAAPVHSGTPRLNVLRHWLLRFFFCCGADSGHRARTRRYDWQSATRPHAHVYSGRNRQLEAERAEATIVLSFFRNHALTLRSNFGDKLIQQSESRNVVGGETIYIQSVRPWLSVLAGVDVRRDAPRNLEPKHPDDQGVFQPVTSNNLTSRSALPSIRCLPVLYKETSRTALSMSPIHSQADARDAQTDQPVP